ncbi:iron-sulfur cluster assembly 2 homolog, mitochondrial [Episyrphus balteatus]|uniref:iron-sulfur cluster assembly 2 homolog, mitochondrial n=1 Tax=Episyrphus balteatus TaxID=286459 RepID=UPI002485B60D|nr:iron-sulfur cluster assembly 2 homolog, mitochondrial [Episyrphus balteatus]
MAHMLRKLILPTLQREICARHIKTSAGNNFPESKPQPEALKIDLSESCTKRLSEICKNGLFLRITVEGGGCSGFQYKFDLDNKKNDDDLTFGKENAQIVIDTTSLEYCSGAIVDYHTELIRSGFRIIANPKAEQGCSCGSSFAIKLD